MPWIFRIVFSAALIPSQILIVHSILYVVSHWEISVQMDVVAAVASSCLAAASAAWCLRSASIACSGFPSAMATARGNCESLAEQVSAVRILGTRGAWELQKELAGTWQVHDSDVCTRIFLFLANGVPSVLLAFWGGTRAFPAKEHGEFDCALKVARSTMTSLSGLTQHRRHRVAKFRPQVHSLRATALEDGHEMHFAVSSVEGGDT